MVAIECDVLSERLFEDAVVFFREVEGVAQNRIGIGVRTVVSKPNRLPSRAFSAASA